MRRGGRRASHIGDEFGEDFQYSVDTHDGGAAGAAGHYQQIGKVCITRQQDNQTL